MARKKGDKWAVDEGCQFTFARRQVFAAKVRGMPSTIDQQQQAHSFSGRIEDRVDSVPKDGFAGQCELHDRPG
ncbi:MAG: hypothetical protein ACON3Z_20100 [Bradymonadia bacterium]